MLYWKEVLDALGESLSYRNNRIKSFEKQIEENAVKISHLEDEIETLKQENEKLKKSGETGSIDIFIKNYGGEAVK